LRYYQEKVFAKVRNMLNAHFCKPS